MNVDKGSIAMVTPGNGVGPRIAIGIRAGECSFGLACTYHRTNHWHSSGGGSLSPERVAEEMIGIAGEPRVGGWEQGELGMVTIDPAAPPRLAVWIAQNCRFNGCPHHDDEPGHWHTCEGGTAGPEVPAAEVTVSPLDQDTFTQVNPPVKPWTNTFTSNAATATGYITVNPTANFA